MTERYIVTWAQNATPPHAPTLAAFKRWCSDHRGQLIVVPGRYKNPTSVWAAGDADDDWWHADIAPYVDHGCRSLSRNLRVFGDMSIQPTATRPLSGFEVFAGKSSGIFGHPRRALEVVPTSTRSPKILWTTGAVTRANYTDSKAGRKAREHHVYGGVIVEVDRDGSYFVRHISTDSQGRFIDLGRRYGPEGDLGPAKTLTLTLGDVHVGWEDADLTAATERLIAELSPTSLVLHDVLDMFARNHHIRTHREWYDRHPLSVENEVERVAAYLTDVSTKVPRVKVVRSNHDEHFERWLDEHRRDRDPRNDPYFCRAWARAYDYREAHGSWPDMLALECRRLGVPKNVDFLRRGDSFRVRGVEHGFHADRGANGARASVLTYVRMGVKVTGAHSHTPWIRDGFFRVGVGSALDHRYNGLPSSWVQACCPLYEDGKRQIVIFVGKRYKGGMR